MSAVLGHLKTILKPVLGAKEYSYVFGKNVKYKTMSLMVCLKLHE